MGYCGPMGYGLQIPAHRVGGSILLWGMRGYGLSQVWVMRSSTVVPYVFKRRTVPGSGVYCSALKLCPDILTLPGNLGSVHI